MILWWYRSSVLHWTRFHSLLSSFLLQREMVFFISFFIVIVCFLHYYLPPECFSFIVFILFSFQSCPSSFRTIIFLFLFRGFQDSTGSDSISGRYYIIYITHHIIRLLEIETETLMDGIYCHCHINRHFHHMAFPPPSSFWLDIEGNRFSSLCKATVKVIISSGRRPLITTWR